MSVLKSFLLFSNRFKISTNRFYSSALYITGDKATSTCALLTPYIDLKLDKLDEIKANAKCRNLAIDFEALKKLWCLYEDLEKTRKKLDLYRTNVSDKIKCLKKQSGFSEDEMTKFINKGKIVREDLKLLKDSIQPIEENLMIQLLQLPNVIHELTSITEERIEEVFLEKPKNSSEHHRLIGEKLNLLKYMNSNAYYLLGDAALMELGLLRYLNTQLDKNNFISFSLPDTVRSAIVEGCGVDFKNLTSLFTIDDPEGSKNDISKLHLTGTASLFSFMAYHTKLMLFPSVFPLNYYSTGRQYKPCINIDNALFEPSQSSCIQLFTATLNSDELMLKEFQKIICMCTDIYKGLNHHFRVVYQSVGKLEKSECLRVSFEMYSSHYNKYIEVGHVSMYDDYLSKRLLFTYKEGKINVFPKVISGTIVNFAKLLGCILEENPKELVVPDVCRF